MCSRAMVPAFATPCGRRIDSASRPPSPYEVPEYDGPPASPTSSAPSHRRCSPRRPRRLRIGITQRIRDHAHVGVPPIRELVVDDLEEFEASERGADVGDRDVVAAGEGLAQEELVQRGEHLADRPRPPPSAPSPSPQAWRRSQPTSPGYCGNSSAPLISARYKGRACERYQHRAVHERALFRGLVGQTLETDACRDTA